MNICIYGAASPQLDQIYYEKTEELGRLMARRGHGLVFGGGETGLMGAAARGDDAEGRIISTLQCALRVLRLSPGNCTTVL